MKIANIEGTTEEIKNFFQDNGLKAADFFEAPDQPIKTIWLVIPAVLVLALLSILMLTKSIEQELRLFVFVLSCFFAIWWSAVLQLRFKNAWATSIVAGGCLLLALVALGVVTPVQMLEEAKALRK